MQKYFRYYQFAKDIILSNFNRLPQPYKLIYPVTNRCNLRCVTCGLWKRKMTDELSIPELEKIFRGGNFSWFNLTGGEPFLREDLPDLIKTIVQNSPQLMLVNITTNGYLTQTIVERMDRLIKLNIPKLFLGISLHGPNAIDGKIRGKPDTFSRAMETYKALKNRRGKNFKPFISYTVSPENIGHLEETLQEIRNEIPDFNIDDFHLNVFYCSEHCYGLKAWDKLESFYARVPAEIYPIVKHYHFSFNPELFLERKFLLNLSKYLKNYVVPLSCKSGQASIFMDAQGDVFPCVIFSKKIANLREVNYDWRKIYASVEYHQIREAIAKKQCPNCWTPCEAGQTILGNLLKR